MDLLCIQTKHHYYDEFMCAFGVIFLRSATLNDVCLNGNNAVCVFRMITTNSSLLLVLDLLFPITHCFKNKRY